MRLVDIRSNIKNIVLACVVLIGAILIFSCPDTDGIEEQKIIKSPISLEGFSFEKAPTLGNTSITFAWTDDLIDVEYNVYLGISNSTVEKINDTPLATKSYTYTYNNDGVYPLQLEPRHTYYWKVVATGIDTGTETMSDTGSFVMDDGISLTSLNGVIDVSVVDDLVFEWDTYVDIFSDANYRVYLGTEKDALIEVTTTALSNTSYTYNPDDGLQFHTTYYWKVVASIDTRTIETETRSLSLRLPITLQAPIDDTQNVFVSLPILLDWDVASELTGLSYTVYLDTNASPSSRDSQ